jgi:hypothetical protein
MGSLCQLWRSSFNRQAGGLVMLAEWTNSNVNSMSRLRGGTNGNNDMNVPMMLIETILAGFFAVACIRACVPVSPNGKLAFSDLLRFPGRIERLRRSRWQWFSMVALLLVVRLQAGLPLVLEAIVAVEFLIFLAVPTRVEMVQGKKSRSINAAIVESR